MWIDFSKIISYNALLNFIVAERGVGKTFGATEFVTRQFINKKDEFVYIRRYKSELQKAIPRFFDALVHEEKFPEHSFSRKGMNLYIDDHVAGYGLTLSTAQQLKSTNFDKVKWIIFDEAFLEDGQGHYLKNEVEIFLGLLETISRMRNVRVLILANATNSANPYFLYFNLHLPYNNEIITFKKGLIALMYAKNLKYREAKKDTSFGKLVAGTDYENYAIDNMFINDNKDFIEKKDKNSKFSFSFIYNDNRYGVWINWMTGKMYISNDFLDNHIVFACTTDDHKPNTMLMTIAKEYHCWRTFIQNYKLGNVYYENNKIKNICRDVMKNLTR
ncbi:MAG: phage DNA encapsidation protein [Clostridia bacterium]|nr:phage DNA encapsidation protein [bacterium]MBR2705033.1 phage DNA encapsidation protein [Clostridia bacterium]